MSPTRSFAVVSRLAFATCGLMFGLIVVGSIVRTTGSGLACPDWPLCHGRLIPPLQFNIMVEWLHRLIALGVGILILATAAMILAGSATRARLGGLAGLGIALYFTQALLGALTVWKLLDPSVVSGHLAVALLLFSTLLGIALLARVESGRTRDLRGLSRPAGLLGWFGAATVLVWLQAVLGGMVSTNHASLACPDWPLCNGEWLPRLDGLVGLHVVHRFGAYALTALLVVVALRSRQAPDPFVRDAGRLLPGLALVQVGVGVTNVLLGIPVWVSAVHLGVAAAILTVSLACTLRLAVMQPEAVAMVEAPAR